MAVTPGSWAKSLLQALGYPVTSANVSSITSWEGMEGGNWNNTARYNPLNTTQKEPGSSAMNSVGVQSYNSWGSGLNATVTTLHNGNYGDILAALKSGKGLHGNYVGLSKWSGGAYSSVGSGSSSTSGSSVSGSSSITTTASSGCPSFLTNPAGWAACQALGGNNSPIAQFFNDPVDAMERVGLVLFGALLILVGIAILGFGPMASGVSTFTSAGRTAKSLRAMTGSNRPTGPTPEQQAERERRLQLAEKNSRLGERKQQLNEEKFQLRRRNAEYRDARASRRAS